MRDDYNERHDEWLKQCPCDDCNCSFSLCQGECEHYNQWLIVEPSEEDITEFY